MADVYASHLDDAKIRLAKLFGKKIAHEIYRYSVSMMDTEKYIMFTKYVRNIVKDYLHAFLLNLICDYWEKNQESLDSETKKKPLSYIQQYSFNLQKKLYNISLSLVGKRLVFDYMSTKAIQEKLVDFFSNINPDDTIREHIKELATFKSTITTSEMDVAGIKNVLESKKETLRFLLKLYLTIKETIYKELGYDVELEYNDIDDFKFTYKDARLEEGSEEFLVLEYQIMQETIKIIEPEGDGNIVTFLEKLRPEVYG